MKSCRECSHQVSDQAVSCPGCGAPYPARERWDGYGFEYKSQATFFGLPLLHVSFKYRANRMPVVAKGVIAVGQFGAGIVTISQFGIGVFSLGQFTIAGYALAQFAAAYACIARSVYMWNRDMGRSYSGWPICWRAFNPFIHHQETVDMKMTFRKRLLQGDQLTGTIISMPCPQMAELLSGAGFDWLFIDGEHGPLSVGDIQLLLQAAQPRCPCVVRLAANDAVHVKQALDTGADGIIAPLVNDADTAARVVTWAKYPPLGARSVGIARAQGYGASFADYVAAANENVAVIVQVEHVDAVANIDSILDVQGIDGVFVGPYDLSASMGKAGQIDDAGVRRRIERIRLACEQRGMPLGIFGADAAAVQPFVEQGYTFIAVGMDSLLLIQSARRILSALKPDVPDQ